jgi:polyhydroxybutyrate depolymerase
MRMMRLVLCTILLVSLSACAPMNQEPTTVEAFGERISVTVGDLDRGYLVRAPERQSDEKLPVLIAMHGVGGNAQEFEDWTRFTSSVDTDRFVAIYPDGAPMRDGTQVWNAGGCCIASGSTPADDVEFLSGILDSVEEYGGDPDQVFVTGFSNGGMMTYRLACDVGERLAGIAVVAGAFNVESCGSTNPLPTIIIHGTADDTVPYDGGLTANSREMGIRGVPNASVADSVEFWTERNGCSVPGTVNESGAVTHERIFECDDASSVNVYTIADGTHTWTSAGGELDMTDLVLNAFIRGTTTDG